LEVPIANDRTMVNFQPIEELKKIASSGYGRQNADRLLGILLQKPELFNDLVSIFLSNEEPVSRRAAWAVDLYAEIHPELLIPLIEEIVSELPRFGEESAGVRNRGEKILKRLYRDIE